MRVLLLAALSTTLLAQQTQTPLAPATQPSAVNPASPATPPGVPAPAPPAQSPTPSASPNSTPAAAPAMSPTDAYLYAMQPFNNARSAPDDLTEADKWALGIAIARAKEQCELHSKKKFEAEDLLAEGKLCIFGQDYEPARHRLINYLALPEPRAPEIGRLLLARAFIGLGSISAAESHMESLLSLFPYDASIHLGIDMVIDAAAASDSADDLAVIPRLNEQQLPPILDALAHGGSLNGNGDSVDAALLVRDALRCADALRRNYKPDDAAKIVAQIKTLVAAPPIVSSASYPAIQNALTRYEMFQQPSPVRELHGAEWTSGGANIARVVPLYDTDPAAHRIVRGSGSHTIVRALDDRTLVLVFSLAGPASSDTIHKILDRLAHDHITPGLKVIAVTSFAANIGVDTPTPQLLAALKAFRALLPPKLPTLIVPDAQLKPFAIDMGPAAILFDGHGRILWLNTIAGSDGSIRQMVREVETPVVPYDLVPAAH
jgi:hypothetical protein